MAIYVAAHEVISRKAASYWDWYGLIVLSNIVIGWGFWYILKSAPNTIVAFVVFSAAMHTSRTGMAILTGQTINPGSWLALLFLYAAVASKFWRIW